MAELLEPLFGEVDGRTPLLELLLPLTEGEVGLRWMVEVPPPDLSDTPLRLSTLCERVELPMVDCLRSKLDVPILGLRELLERLVRALLLRELPDVDDRVFRLSSIDGLLDRFDLEGVVRMVDLSKFELLLDLVPL